MCEELIPSPVENAKQKVGKIYRGTCDTVRYEDIATRMAGCSEYICVLFLIIEVDLDFLLLF